MSETTVGVIIVAVIALAGTFITAIIGLLTWRRNLKCQILRDERNRIEKKFERYLPCYLDCLKKNLIEARLGAAFLWEFPESVRKEFGKALKGGAFSANDVKVKQNAYFTMAFEMSKAIANYDQDIRKTYELVDTKKGFEIATEIIQRGLLKW